MEYGCNLQVHQPRPFFTLIAIIDIWNKLFQHDGEGLRYVLLLVPDICRVLLVGIVDYLTHIERVDRPGGQPAGVRHLHHPHLDSGHPALGGREVTITILPGPCPCRICRWCGICPGCCRLWGRRPRTWRCTGCRGTGGGRAGGADTRCPGRGTPGPRSAPAATGQYGDTLTV